MVNASRSACKCAAMKSGTATFGLEGVGEVGFYGQSAQVESLLPQPSKNMCSSGFTSKGVLIKISLSETT